MKIEIPGHRPYGDTILGDFMFRAHCRPRYLAIVLHFVLMFQRVDVHVQSN